MNDWWLMFPHLGDGLDEHRAFLSGIARPSIEIVTVDAPASRCCSKFGGAPDLPSDFAWPHHDLGPYRFIGQVNLSDIPKGPHGLPATGLLSFFYAHDEDGESFWGDPGYMRAYHFGEIDSLESVEPPETVHFGATATIRFELGADIPPWPWETRAAQEWPIDESLRDAYGELRFALHPSGRYLLGYPLNTTLGYDPTPGPDWRSLLTLASDEDLEWCWHDDDWLVAFIEEQQLRTCDFSQIRSDAG